MLTHIMMYRSLPFDRQRLESLEMYPFKVMVNQGVQSVMIGHLVVPALDTAAKTPASLSNPYYYRIFKKKTRILRFSLHRCLRYERCNEKLRQGEIEVKGSPLNAGVDVLLLSGRCRNICGCHKRH